MIVVDQQDTLQHFQALFNKYRHSFPGESIEWIKALREKSFQRFVECGLPTRKNEAWHYTAMQPRLDYFFSLSGLTDSAEVTANNMLTSAQRMAITDVISRAIPEGMPHFLLVFVNGYYMPDYALLSELPCGLTLMNLKEALTQKEAMLKPYFQAAISGSANADYPFYELNTALMTNGVFLHVARNSKIDVPIYCMRFVTQHAQPVMMSSQDIIVLEEGADVIYVETNHALPVESTDTLKPVFSTLLTRCYASSRAHIQYYKLQTEQKSVCHVSHARVDLVDRSQFHAHTYTLGAGLSREEIHVTMRGEHSVCELNGLSVLSDSQQADHNVLVEHTAAHATSKQFYKSIVGGSAKNTFTGKAIVRPNAVNTDAQQTNKNLLLSQRAVANTRPTLEIYVDDVKCAHGATVGQIDHDMLFYLRSRGISVTESLNLLTQGFANDVIERITYPSFQAYIKSICQEKFSQSMFKGVDNHILGVRKDD